MKKVLSLVLVTILLLSGLFVLTGCGEKNTGVETSTTLGDIKITAKVPGNEEGQPTYTFTTEKPENTIYFTGSTYLTGEKVNIAFESKKVLGTDSKTYSDMLNFIKSDSYTGTVKIKEELKIGDRDAIKTNFYYGANNDSGLYGYRYYINIDDVTAGQYMEVVVVKGDFSNGEIDAYMSDEAVSAIVNSLKFSK
mgnify:CR=1 FL=1